MGDVTIFDDTCPSCEERGEKMTGKEAVTALST